MEHGKEKYVYRLLGSDIFNYLYNYISFWFIHCLKYNVLSWRPTYVSKLSTKSSRTFNLRLAHDSSGQYYKGSFFFHGISAVETLCLSPWKKTYTRAVFGTTCWKYAYYDNSEIRLLCEYMLELCGMSVKHLCQSLSLMVWDEWGVKKLWKTNAIRDLQAITDA